MNLLVVVVMLLPGQHSWLQSLSVKNQKSPFAAFLSGTEGLARNHETQASGSVVNFDIAMTKFIINKRTDA